MIHFASAHSENQFSTHIKDPIEIACAGRGAEAVELNWRRFLIFTVQRQWNYIGEDLPRRKRQSKKEDELNKIAGPQITGPWRVRR